MLIHRIIPEREHSRNYAAVCAQHSVDVRNLDLRYYVYWFIIIVVYYFFNSKNICEYDTFLIIYKIVFLIITSTLLILKYL